MDLERLSTEAGRDLLSHLGVEGKDEELEEVTEEVHGHDTLCLSSTAWSRSSILQPMAGWEHLEMARKIVEETGYGRREREVRELSEALGVVDE